MNRFISYLAGGLAVLTAGCSGNGTTGVFNQPSPRVKVVNAIDGVSTANWLVTGQNGVVFPPVGFGSVSGSTINPYAILNERGQQTVDFYSSAAPTVVVASAQHTFTYGDKLDVVAYGPQTAGNTVVLYDQTSNSSNGPNIRIVDAAQQLGNLDVFVTPTGIQPSGSPSSIVPGGVYPAQTQATSYTYAALPLAGSYTATLYPQGQDTGTPLLTFTLTVQNTDVWTLVVVDPVTSGGAPSGLAIQDNNPNAG